MSVGKVFQFSKADTVCEIGQRPAAEDAGGADLVQLPHYL